MGLFPQFSRPSGQAHFYSQVFTHAVNMYFHAVEWAFYFITENINHHALL